MKVRIRILGLALVLFAAVSASAQDQWISVKSSNFDLVGNASEADIRDVATRLEQFRVVFGKLFRGIKLNSPIPTTVIVFKDDASFAPYRSNRWTAGYFLSSEDKNYIALSVGQDKEETYSTIFHEYVHFLIISNFGREKIPAWFNEGLAEYYDKFQIRDERTFAIGGISRGHLETLRRIEMIPFDQFFAADHSDLRSQGNHGLSIFYAQAWAFVHYLMQESSGKRSGQFNDFMNRTLNGEDPTSAFKAAFGNDFSVLEKELREYISKPEEMTFSIFRLDEPLDVDTRLSVKPISDGEAIAYRGDLLYRNGFNARAETMLRRALAADSNSTIANSALGLIRIRQGKLAEARRYLRTAIKASPDDYSVYYYLAYALAREDGFSPATGQEIRRLAKRSISLNPEFAPSYDLMANVSLELNSELDEGISYAQRGVALAPGDQGFQLNLANLYVRKEQTTRAKPIVESILKNPENPEIRSYAQKLGGIISEIERRRGRPREGRSASANRGDRPTLSRNRGRPQGMTREEFERRKREVEIEGINNALRQPLADEARTVGYLNSITCSQETVTYSIASGANRLQLVNRGFGSIKFMTFNVNLDGLEIGCDSIKKPLFGVFTFRKADRELVQVEFVPEYFKLAGSGDE